ncbi:MAG: methylmalonyl-CoA carboxyltransferase [Alphaproteobacteria bacterium]|jgi:methylmalonyl-CoA decarboxylase subunit alpha|nr:methylmalonyl-CoA carboxyltransferase [Alphaproteobacteria bacterium]
MAHEDKIAELERRRAEARAMGGERKLAARRNAGVLNARERLDYLLDDGSFLEAGLHAYSIRPETREKSAADGKIAGYGMIDGRPAALVANDFTVLGASSSQVNMKKMGHMKKTARERRMPLVLLGESSGGRMPDRMGASGRATIGQDREEYRRTRDTPWVSTLMGQSYGSSTWYSVISDVVFARKGAVMAVTSPRVTSIAISQDISAEELGGWELHAKTTGLVDAAFDTDEEVLDAVKTYLSYMPSYAGEAPPRAAPGAADDQEKLLELVPETRRRVYDMRKVLNVIADQGSIFELKALFGRAVITAFARIEGRVVGFLANNPRFKAGAIDPDACDKAVSFIVLCDSFNIPLISMVDQPGFFIGVEGERKRAPGKIMNWMNALAQVTVPRFSVIVRKSFGQAYLNMGGGRNADEVLAWPMADLGFMEPRLAVNVLHGIKAEDDPERFEALAAELERDTEAWDLAGLYEAQYVIDPRETRAHLARLLEVYEGRQVGEHHLSNWPTTF